jgi:hypothetical protein
MNNKAREYSSPILERIISGIDPKEQLKCDKRMMLALKIYNAMLGKGWKKGDLARAVNKQPSVITKWLSGTHNFESDTLFDLEDVLGINLISVEEKRQPIIMNYYNSTQTIIQADKYGEVIVKIPPRNIFIQKLEKQKAS